MSTTPYNYLQQAIQATSLILAYTNDSFFYPQNQKHTGFAFDGFWYSAGVVDKSRIASWYSENSSSYRGVSRSFPTTSLVLLSRASLVILDESNPDLTLWIQFLIHDNFALTHNFSGQLISFFPSDLAYSDGVIAVSYKPDLGSAIQNLMVVSLDFAKDKIYLDTAVAPS
jgi:hypothetical protein